MPDGRPSSAAGEGDRLLLRAVALHVLARLREAEAAARQAIELLEPRIEGRGALAAACDELASILDSAARYKEAEAHHRRAGELLVVLPSGTGFDHNRVQYARGLAANLSAQGRLPEAHDILVPALAYAEQVLGRDDPDASAVLVDLAATCDGLGNAGVAEVLYRDALDRVEVAWPANAAQVAAVAASLSRLLQASGRSDEAAAMVDRAVRAAAQIVFDPSPGRRSSERLAEMVTARHEP